MSHNDLTFVRVVNGAILPVSWFFLRFKYTSWERLPNSFGMVPVS